MDFASEVAQSNSVRFSCANWIIGFMLKEHLKLSLCRYLTNHRSQIAIHDSHVGIFKKK
jgi:hypothetical protein